MTLTRDMLASHPRLARLDLDDVAAAIDACLACGQACTTCADACLSEEADAALERCAAVDAQCADACFALARALSRPSAWGAAVTERLLQACVCACGDCAEECERHAEHHVHCRLCAEACRRCAEACATLLREDVAEQLRRFQGG